MIEAHVIELVTNYLPNIHHLNDAFQQLHLHTIASLQQIHLHLQTNWTVLAQQVQDPDVLGQMQRAFNNFIKSGQVWAFGIGIVLGYLIKGFTTF